MYTYPIEEIRSRFPALKRTVHGRKAVYFDGPGGSQTLDYAIDAMAGYMRDGVANLHGLFPTSIETEAHIASARNALADLLSAKPHEIAFGANATTLLFSVSRALSRRLKPGDEIVVTEIDHRANVDPWIQAAKDKGADVKWIPLNTETLTLDLSGINSIITEKTRVVAVNLASNCTGSVNDLSVIAKRAKEVGAVLAVDAVHAVPHMSININEIGADVLFFSTYKFFGAHLGVAFVKDELFEKLNTYKLEPAPDYMPDKLETGTQNHEGIAAIPPVIDFIANLGSGENRRDKIISAYKNIESHENKIADYIREELAATPMVTLYQPVGPKTPTISFTINGFNSADVCGYMCDEHGVFIASGDFYATTMAEKLGVNKHGGFIRAGLAPYNTMDEADVFLLGIRNLIHNP